MKKNVIVGLCLLLSIGVAKSQVTIGAEIQPSTGALLDLKEYNSTSTDPTTSTKGLILPRVKLTDKENLYPMFENNGSGDYQIGTIPYVKADEDKKHIGLMVYHLDECSMYGKGVYVWTVGGWTFLGARNQIAAGLNLSHNTLKFYNGIGNIAQDVNVSWRPNDASTTAPTITSSGLNYTLKPSSLVSSPQKLSIKPYDMTYSELDANLFAKKTGSINFNFANSPCTGGAIQTETINVTQINKSIKINGQTYPEQIETVGSVIPDPVTVQSNAEWSVSISPTSNPAVSNLSRTTGGSEIEDGSPNPPTQNINYDITVGTHKSRYNFLTFSDQNTPKRFNDVVLTIAQCNGESDLTLVQYKNLWEQMYGLDPLRDEPNSNGNVVKNKNKVQWHYDQDGNIFFSGMFGTERWMLNNLVAKKYDTGISDPPSLTPNYEPLAGVAYYGYPNQVGERDPELTTEYDARQRLGLLYNWYAATAGKNTSTVNQEDIDFSPNHYQGICPNGWHLPGILEWANLMATLAATPEQWSKYEEGDGTVATIKDMCEPDIGTGKSFGVLDGGFSALPPGMGNAGEAKTYPTYGVFWTANNFSNKVVWVRAFNTGRGEVTQNTSDRLDLYSVRCKKD